MINRKLFRRCGIWLWFILISLLCYAIVAFLTGSLPVKQKVSASMPLQDFQSHMNERIHTLMQLYSIPGCSIALVSDNEIVWTEAYGYANLENDRALTADTPMRVQSISKPVTAWGVLKLWEQGEINLDSPISQYLTSWNLPDSEFTTEEVTVRRLLSHTAGLPLGDVFTIYSPGEAMPSLKDKLSQEVNLVQKPGTRFSYSNTGYNLLELLIEEVTEKDFSEYMRTEVLQPLNMHDSFFDWSDIMTPAPPTGYDLNGKPVPAYVYPEKASGGLFATAEDIARFALAGMQKNTVLKSDSVELMHTSVSDEIGIYGLAFDAYGLGHYIETAPNGAQSVSHGGQGTGIMTHLHAVPDTGDAIVILTNSQRSWPFIASLLSDWAQWRALPTVGMGKIIWGRYVFSAMISIILSAALMMFLRMLNGIKQKKAKRKGIKLRRIDWIQIGISLIFIGILIWSMCQKYLFLTSVFPILSVWLGGAVMVFSIVLILNAVTRAATRIEDQLSSGTFLSDTASTNI